MNKNLIGHVEKRSASIVNCEGNVGMAFVKSLYTTKSLCNETLFVMLKFKKKKNWHKDGEASTSFTVLEASKSFTVLEGVWDGDG